MAFGRLGSIGAGFGHLGSLPGGGVALPPGGAGMLIDETNGFAADFSYATDAQRVAVKTAGSVVMSGTSFFTSSGSSAKYVFNSSGVLVSVPSGTVPILYNPVTLVPRGQPVEAAATNLLPDSPGLGVPSGWTTGVGLTKTLNATGPRGANTAHTLTMVAGTGSKWVYSGDIGAGTYRYSIFAKAGSLNWFSLGQGSGSAANAAFFNLSAGTVGTVAGTASAATIEPAGNGFYRCAATFTSSSFFAIQPTNADNVGIGWTAAGGETLLVADPQAETGAVATSYILTPVGVTATRAADNYTFLLSAIPALGSTYSIYCRFSTPSIASAKHVVVVTDGTTSEFAGFNANTTARLAVVDGGVAVGAITGPTLVANTVVSVAARIKLNDCAMSVAGGAAGADTTVTLPTVTQVRFGNDGSNAAASGPFLIEKLMLVPRGWSDAELAAKSLT